MTDEHFNSAEVPFWALFWTISTELGLAHYRTKRFRLAGKGRPALECPEKNALNRSEFAGAVECGVSPKAFIIGASAWRSGAPSVP